MSHFIVVGAIALVACGQPAPGGGGFSCAGSAPESTPLPPLPELPRAPIAHESARGEARPARELTLSFVGEVRGELEPCGCPTLPYGGFERRIRLVERLRAKGTHLHFDTGELLLKGFSTQRDDRAGARAELLLELSRQAGLDAWAPGPTDLLALGTAGLEGLPIPAISATWSAGEVPLLPATRIIEKDGLRVGVIGLSAAAEGVRSMDAAEAAQLARASLPTDLDLVVGLSNLASGDADRVAASGAVSLLLSTRGDELEPERQRAGAAPVIEVPARGRYLRLVDLRLGTTAEGPMLGAPDDAAWRERDARRDREIRRDDPPRLAEALEEIEAEFEQLGSGRNLFRTRTIPLASDLDGESAGSELIEAHKSKVLALAAEAAAAPSPTGFASSGGCAGCHSAEFARWTFSDHARGWESLVTQKQTENAECVPCHTTGFGEPGGLGELTTANIRKYKAVQCEACHGPLAGHPEDDTISARSVTEETCVSCHDEANSPSFSFQPYLLQATCQGDHGREANP